MLIVAEHASMSQGGESCLPIHWFRGLLREDVDVRLLVHARNQPELDALLGAHASRLSYVRDTLPQKILWRLGAFLPEQIRNFTIEWFLHLFTQFAQRRAARRMIEQFGINIVHEPTPVSPRLPSMIHGLGIPVVIGPMNGNMTYPPGLASPSFLERVFVPLARGVSDLANTLIPGKRRAALLLVANERSRRALPRGCSGRVAILCENGVDPDVWRRPDDLPARSGEVLRLGFLGRLVHWKGADVVLDVFDEVRARTPSAELWIIGDGPERGRLQRQVEALGLSHAVTFHGWVDPKESSRLLSQCDVFLYPSMRDCGGAVVLEAMALGLPVVALNWGGVGEYLAPGCGVAVEPAPRPQLIAELVQAVQGLTPETRRRLGAAAQREIAEKYTWPAKVRQVLKLYATACDDASSLARKVEAKA
ncbi:glycosyltransferase family 4 protein [Tautonia marina]|uniref:glycosyltransferase family 4 protein n=1 Tax=Tautonia marina TaxID=2653855 RepID=UPI0013763314|nr:glycosyltransferase [Tautonia marina]